jgi:glycosyltransferase involved in cell wall biosynthesis
LIATQQLFADKGHDVILRALAGVNAPFVLHVAGDGPLETELKRLAAELDLSNRVIWHGFSTDVSALLGQSDIFLLASLYEGLPNTMLEAMAHGLLPIVRDVGGVREALTPELESWLLPEDAGSLAFRAAIERALAMPDADLLAVCEASRAACRLRCDINTLALDLERWLANEVIHEQ